MVDGLVYQEKTSIRNCEVCCRGKKARLPFPKEGSRARKLLEVIHSDVCGPIETTSLGGAKYFITFTDDFSRMCFVYFMKSKDEQMKHMTNSRNSKTWLRINSTTKSKF